MKNKIFIFFLLILFLPIKLFAAELNKFEISLKKDERCFHSNGIPNHKTGIFPNKGNPNSISQQKLKE